MDKRNVVKNALKGVGKAVVNKTADVIGGAMAIPDKMRAGRYGQAVKAIKAARSYDNAPNFNDDGSVTDAFNVRSVKTGLVNDYLNRVKKGKN